MRLLAAAVILTLVSLSIMGSGADARKSHRHSHGHRKGHGRYSGRGGVAAFQSKSSKSASASSSKSSSSSSVIKSGRGVGRSSRWCHPQIFQQNAQDVSQQLAQVQSMKEAVVSRWSSQKSEWHEEQQKQESLETKITQNDQSLLSTYQEEKQAFTQSEQHFQEEKEAVTQKFTQVEETLTDLKQKNQEVLQAAEAGTATPEQAKALLTEYRQKQQEILTQLPAALGEAEKAEEGHGGMREKVNKWSQGYMTNPVLIPSGGGGGGGDDNNWDKWLNADYWEQHHEEMWGGFEQFFGKWQNWVNDKDAGNYKLANRRWGAFDNGDSNLEKTSEEFFGPDHVANDPTHGQYTDNSGFGSSGGAGGADQSGAGGSAAGGYGGSDSGGSGGDAGLSALVQSLITILEKNSVSVSSQLTTSYTSTISQAIQGSWCAGCGCAAGGGGAAGIGGGYAGGGGGAILYQATPVVVPYQVVPVIAVPYGSGGIDINVL